MREFLDHHQVGVISPLPKSMIDKKIYYLFYFAQILIFINNVVIVLTTRKKFPPISTVQ
jgi:hypothetical protein